MGYYGFILVSVLMIANFFSFAVYGNDKNRAVKKKWRTPERTLLICGLIGPFGAVAAMHYFRHKTQKAKFKLNYLFAVIHIVIIAAVVYYLG